MALVLIIYLVEDIKFYEATVDDVSVLKRFDNKFGNAADNTDAFEREFYSFFYPDTTFNRSLRQLQTPIYEARYDMIILTGEMP